MLKNVLIPLDGSLLAEQAVGYVQRVLPAKGSVTLLTVIRLPNTYFATEVPLPMVYSAADITRLLEDEVASARQYLEDVAQRLRRKGFSVFVVVETGDPPIVIVDQARYFDAVMMTTHGRTGLSRLLYGSVTQQVLGLSPRPVIVVPNRRAEEQPEAEAVTETDKKAMA